MNYNRIYFGITFDPYKKDIYVLGGYSYDYLSRCEKYSVEND